MSELQFPKNPVVGQQYDFPPYRYYWDGIKWKTIGIGYNPVNDLRDELEPRIEISEKNIKDLSAQSFEALRRSYAEAGLTLVDGSFEEGATVTLKTQVVWQQATGKVFGWFQDAVKTVAAGSTPATTGGIGAGAWVDRTQDTIRDELNIVVRTFDSVFSMQNDTKLTAGMIVETLSYHGGWAGLATPPNGGNKYEIVSAGIGVDDGGSFISLSNGLLAKGLFVSGVVDLHHFGFNGDEDNRQLLQRAINFTATTGRELNMPENTSVNITLVGGIGITIPDNTVIRGNNSTITITNTNLQTYKIVSFENFAKHIRISDLFVIGDVPTNTQISGEWGMGFQLASNDDVILTNCGAKHCWGDGIYLGIVGGVADTNGTIILNNFNADDNRRQGMSIISCRNLIVKGGNYNNTGKTKYTAPGCGIDIEPNAKDVCDINALFIGVNAKNNKRQGFLLSLQNAGNPDFLIDGKDFVEINVRFENCKSLFDGGLQDYIPAIRVIGVGDNGSPAHKIKGSIVFENPVITDAQHVGIEFLNMGYIPDVIFNDVVVTDIMCAKSEGETLNTSSIIQMTQRGNALTMAGYDYSKVIIDGISYTDTRGDTYNDSNNATAGYHRVRRPVWFYDGVSAVTPFPRNWITINNFKTNIQPKSGLFSNIGNVFKIEGVRPNYTILGNITTYSGYVVGTDLVCEHTGSLQTVYLPDSTTYPQYVGQTINYYSDNPAGYLRFIPHGTDVMVNRDGVLQSGAPFIYQRAYPQGNYRFKCISAGVWMIL